MKPIAKTTLSLSLLLAASVTGAAFAQTAARGAKPVPATRTEMKQALDQLKGREPRLPLPPPTAEEIERAKNNPNPARGLGAGLVNNARMRNLYLPEELRGPATLNREPDPRMTLKAPFITEIFWIVSRLNNCHYCLGHQEAKLTADGLSDDDLARLDGDWSELPADRRAAFTFSRKLTVDPQRVTAADLEPLRDHYTDLQILEIVLLTARYNATNRWTDSLGIPQEDHREYLSPTSPAYETRRSAVALLPAADKPGPALPPTRPALESASEVVARIDSARRRQPALPLVSVEEARQALPDLPAGPVPAWIRLLANFPKTGVAMARIQRQLPVAGNLPPLLRAQIAWVAARHDRAWYALNIAHESLIALGQSAAQIDQLTAPGATLSPGDQLALQFTAKLTATPQWIGDDDIAGLRKHFTDAQVAEIVYRVTQANQFDRLTEAAQLPVDPPANVTP
ncbi:MAG: carboxymuconolactone decarboxylase family protein [Planctomycetaceae bacterium]